jgi:hypothetical protein
MKAEVKKIWLEALRSGEYKQTQLRLNNGQGGFCCLGVLCDLYQKEQTRKKKKKLTESTYLYHHSVGESRVSYNKNEIFLPVEVVKWAGLESSNPDIRVGGPTLSGMNDDGKSFKQIAIVIEKYF